MRLVSILQLLLPVLLAGSAPAMAYMSPQVAIEPWRLCVTAHAGRGASVDTVMAACHGDEMGFVIALQASDPPHTGDDGSFERIYRDTYAMMRNEAAQYARLMGKLNVVPATK